MINRSNIRAFVLLNLLNSLQKRDKMLGKPRIYHFSPTRLVKAWPDAPFALRTAIRSALLYHGVIGSAFVVGCVTAQADYNAIIKLSF